MYTLISISNRCFLVLLFGGLVIILMMATTPHVNAQFISPIVTPTTPPPTPELSIKDKIALEYFSNKFNVPVNKLHVGGAVTIQYPLIQKTVWQATVATNDGKSSEIVTIDMGTNVIENEALLQLQEENFSIKKYGKLDTDLYDYLQTAKDDELIPLSIWYVADTTSVRNEILARYPEAKLMGHQPSLETDLKLYDKIFAEIIAAEKKVYQDGATPIIEDLKSRGLEIESFNELAPIIYGKLTKNQILQVSDRADTLKINLDKELQPLLDSTSATGRFPAVWARNITGTNTKVAIIDAQGIYFAHTYLTDGTYSNPGTPNVGSHATMVAGIIASTHSTYRGVAYGVPALYSANAGSFSISNLENATTNAVNANSNVLNMSLGNDSNGVLQDFTMFADHMAFQYLRTVVAASGNSTTEEVNTPALGYNVIAVGGISDNDTPNWSDDQIWVEALPPFFTGSSYYNTQNGREKPEVVADADSVTTTDINNGFSVPTDAFSRPWAGTSGATAQVSGLAALLMQRDAVLKSWPQTVKSVIMASAVHNIESSNTEGGNPIVSDKDGIGAIDADLADRILSNNWFKNDLLASGNATEIVFNVDVMTGERIRVVLSWLSHTSLGSTRTDVLATNLDLRVEDKDSIFVNDSLSTVDNFEAVEFTAAKSGQYRFKVVRPSASSVSENFSLAWSKQATYLPDIRLDSSGWNSSIYYRNHDAQPRTIKVTLINPNGSTQSIPSAYLAPNAIDILNTSNTNINNWVGTAIVDGSEDVSVMVLQERTTPYTTDAYAGISNPTNDVRIPIVQKGNVGNNSSFYVQNAGSVPTYLTVQFFPSTGTCTTCSYSPGVLIQPGGRRGIDVSLISDLSATFIGSARITNSANQPLAVVALQIKDSGGVSHMLAWSNTQPPATTLYAPLVQNGNAGINSGLGISSPGSGTFNVTYYSNGSYCTADSSSLNPWIFTPVPINTGCAGLTILSAKLTFPSNMVAGVNQTKSGGQASTYAAISQLGKVAYVPKYKWDSTTLTTGWKDGFTIMNPNTSNVNVTVTLYNAAGNAMPILVNNQVIAPNASLVVFSQFASSGIATPFTGSAVIVATQPVAVTVNSLKKVGTGDELGSYLATHR